MPNTNIAATETHAAIFLIRFFHIVLLCIASEYAICAMMRLRMTALKATSISAETDFQYLRQYSSNKASSPELTISARASFSSADVNPLKNLSKISIFGTIVI